jgi:sporulation protein YlmC with PRC-barrel domain
MNPNRLLMSTALAVALGGYAGALHAQTSAPSNTPPAMSQPSGSIDKPNGAERVQMDNEVRAERLIGGSVRNPQNESVGKIADLVLDEKGSVTAVVVSVGGFLGIGDKHVAVPWTDVKIEDGGKTAVIPMNKDQLKSAAAFKTREAAMADRESEAQRQRAREQTTPRPAQSGAPATTPVK